MARDAQAIAALREELLRNGSILSYVQSDERTASGAAIRVR